jgi:uncharacterized membrane protein YqhA
VTSEVSGRVDRKLRTEIESSRTHVATTRLLPGLLASSTIGVAIGIAGLALSGLTLFIYGFVVIVREIWDAVREHSPDIEGLQHLQVIFVEVTDVFLLAAVLYILGLGLLQLFIDPTLGDRLPGWLQITSLDQLKNKLVGVLAVLLAVTFTAKVVEWEGSRDVLYLGIAIATVIISLGLLISIFARDDHSTEDDSAESGSHST